MLRTAATLMTRVGLVRLRSGESLAKVRDALGEVSTRLYVAIPTAEDEALASLQARLGAIYHAAFTAAPNVDTLVLLKDHRPADVSTLCGYTDERAEAENAGWHLHVLSPSADVGDAIAAPGTAEEAEKRYSHVCMGGTFDRLHNGQKLLLSAAASRMKPGGRLFCGIAGDALFKEKALRELIQPYGRRERVVRHFLSSIRPDVVYELSELTDGYGPSINDAAIQAIVVTEETVAGGAKCNKKRAEKGMSAMDVVVVGLISGGGRLQFDQPHEEKLSSTGQRQANIGSLLTTQLMCKRNAAQTYVIGITGGIASGKSTVCQYLEQEKTEDVEVLNADVLGHRAYDAGTDANRRIRELFPSAAAEDGTVDRKALGGCVFGAGNEGNMKKLTDIVWPVIADGIRAKIAECRKRVLVVEAAILKEAGWENICDEVWAVVVPPSVAKERLMKRNSLTAEEAEKRIASQLPSSERISTAHLLLSSHKDEAALFASVDEAWRGLLGRVDVTFESLSGDGLPQRLAGLLAASAHPATRAAHWWRELRDRYTGSGRDYHNLGHLDEMFGLLDTYRSKLARPDLVAYAIFFHDAVYDPTAKNPLNEQRSADLWRVFAAENRAAGGGVTAEDEELVASWIVRTANHMKGEASGDLAYFLDIDLAVLGRAPPHYAEYAEQISLEYNHVGFRDFARLRPLALAGFVDKPEGPYYTTDFQAAFGQRALANVRAEISRLEEISAKL
eukprot:Rhum_TRINITY_DN14478_c0_g1::Rhum_TRINITY_DN14478_c0_g1_i3::g.90298::m.90298/K02318/COASY; phosphopantetheine adenylyltransferase / dephospho-CoA kinase